VSRILKPENERAHLSLLEGSQYEYFFFVTNTDLLSEKVVISYEKCGNVENYIKEAKYDMAVGHLLLKSFWANKDLSFEVCISYSQNNQNRKICNYEVVRKLSVHGSI
jgi:hypothetical protein